MPQQFISLGAVFRAGIAGPDGKMTREFQMKLQEWDNKLIQSLTMLGEIKDTLIIQGRTEGIGTTVGHINSAGQLQAPGVAFTVDAVPDGVSFVRTNPNQRDGGGRGFAALDSNDRLVSGFHNNPVNVALVPTSATSLANDGISTAITIGATTNQFDFGTVSYSSGSVDPGVFGGPYFIYADDPTFAGGAVAYQFTTSLPAQVAAAGRIYFGSITTTGGSAKTGGGQTGGTGGGVGGHGYSV